MSLPAGYSYHCRACQAPCEIMPSGLLASRCCGAEVFGKKAEAPKPAATKPKGKARIRERRIEGMNETERRYAAHLEEEKKAGRILRWDFEPETFRLAEGFTYRPDFRVVNLDATIEFIDTKGSKKHKSGEVRPYMTEKGRPKPALAAEAHPLYTFVIVWQVGVGKWGRKEY